MIRQVCKCCQRTMEVSESAHVATCPFCEKQQTLPSCHNPKQRKQYAELCVLRQSGAFSAAEERIASMLQSHPKESEWYWQRLLCRYGMVYLPETGKRTYTLQCTHPSEISIADDPDYQAALQFATPDAKNYYEADATLLEQERMDQCNPPNPEQAAEFLLESGFRSLEAEHWLLAAAQFDLLLQRQPENANAHLGKMMAQLQVRREEELLKTGDAMEQTEQYALLMQHADPAFREKILQYEKKAKYQQAVIMKEKANSVEALQAAIDLLATIPNDPDAERLSVVCQRQIRERMLAYSEVLVGCHAAEHLILSGEGEEKRIIVAKYYYDSDTTEEEQAAAEAEKHTSALQKNSGLRTVLMLIAIVGLLAALLIVLLVRRESPKTAQISKRYTTSTISEWSTTSVKQTDATTATTAESLLASAVTEPNVLVQTEPLLGEDALVSGDYRYALSGETLHRAEAVGSSTGSEAILESVQQILSDQEERLLYLQNGVVGFFYRDGSVGTALSAASVKKMFLLPVTQKETDLFLLSEDGTLSVWHYLEESAYYESYAILLPNNETAEGQMSGWDAVETLTVLDHVLIGLNAEGTAIKAVPLQYE